MKKVVCFLVIILAATCIFVACEDAPDNALLEIKITQAPDKVVYEPGEDFDPSGMVVTAYYRDGSTEVIENYSTENSSALKTYVKNIRISYRGRAAYQEVQVIHRGNDEAYSVANTPMLQNSVIEGKSYYFLGSSVTLGSAALEESMADFIAKRNNCTVTKEAVSGTTLADTATNSYVSRMTKLDKTKRIDAFICQLSTNDTKFESYGDVISSFDISAFDKTTTCGAIEYIIAYATATWGCDVVFYTNCNYDSEAYAKMAELLYDINAKWGITVLDLYNDSEFNDITDVQRALYMDDQIHPTRAGYREWWTPEFEKCLISLCL